MTSQFEAELLRPANQDETETWAFVILPKAVSKLLPRRGRTSVLGTINGHEFRATLEPDGQLSHWLKIDASLLSSCSAHVGETVTIEVSPVDQEPEPGVPEDLLKALAAAPEAKSVWEKTTTIARLDWIHWIDSAKQSKTRDKRIRDACDMLAKGKGRVCCFDPSGFYSKALSAPKVQK